MKRKGYKVAIVDDEIDGRGVIEHLLREYFPELQVALVAESIDEATLPLSQSPPHLLFLDVEMGSTTGFDLLERITLNNTIVIFVTAFSEYAIKAIKASAFDYLLKPIDVAEFKQTVNKALGVLVKQENMLKEALKKSSTQRMALPSLTGYDIIDYNTILYCEADGNYTTIYFADKKPYTVSNPLVGFEQELAGFGFVRVHHKYLINMAHLKAYRKGKGGGTVILNNKKEIEVSARKKTELLKRLVEL